MYETKTVTVTVMHNSQPIGIFDSGVGGLSVLNEIHRSLPHENLIYIADSAFTPYGNKPLEFVQQRCHDLTQFLLEQGVKTVVVACNTATAAAVGALRRQFSVPIIAMEPGVRPAIAATRTGVVGVMATENTLASQQFTSLLHRYAENVQVISQPCPGLVEQIETGEFDSDKTYQLIRQFTDPLLSAGADTIVLGCTHYPLVRKQIVEIIGPNISIIETGQAVAQQLNRKLLERQLLSGSTEYASIKFWTSGDGQHIGKVVSAIQTCPVEVKTLPAHLINKR